MELLIQLLPCNCRRHAYDCVQIPAVRHEWITAWYAGTNDSLNAFHQIGGLVIHASGDARPDSITCGHACYTIHKGLHNLLQQVKDFVVEAKQGTAKNMQLQDKYATHSHALDW